MSTATIKSRKIGRPFKEDKMDRIIRFGVRYETLKLLETYCNTAGVTLSELLREFVETGIRAKYNELKEKE